MTHKIFFTFPIFISLCSCQAGADLLNNSPGKVSILSGSYVENCFLRNKNGKKLILKSNNLSVYFSGSYSRADVQLFLDKFKFIQVEAVGLERFLKVRVDFGNVFLDGAVLGGLLWENELLGDWEFSDVNTAKTLQQFFVAKKSKSEFNIETIGLDLDVPVEQ